jgi:hypothetical protein
MNGEIERIRAVKRKRDLLRSAGPDQSCQRSA